MRIPTPLRFLLRPFRDARRPLALAAAGIGVQLASCLLLAVPWLTVNPSHPLLVIAAVLAPLAGVAAATPWLTAVQRERFRALARVDIPEARQSAGRYGIGTRAGRRQAVYHLLAGPLVALGGALTLLLGLVSSCAATIYVWVWPLPMWRRLSQTGYTVQAGYVTAAGLAGLYATAWLTGALARADGRTALRLLGPSREERLARRVEDLTERRADVVDAADAERRRIERDLHDGAQQRLVSMAVNLGLAKVTLTDLPDDARKVIDEAHREAKEAIAELSSLVRGLHPAVLEDRGLDAALSGIAARAPLPVRLKVDLASRPSPTIEAVAYFVVSEALTNVVKHAQASGADVTVERFGGILLVVVSDDGVGGADVSPGGTGLAGLAKRVASVDGTFSISSPPGGPTVVTVELPCAL